MEKKLAKALLEKYRNNTCTKEERALVEAWYAVWNEDEVENHLSDEQLNAAEKRIYRKLQIKRPMPLWQRLLAAAAAVAAIVFGVWFYNTSGLFGGRHLEGDPSLSSRVNAKDLNGIAPGRNTATLKIGDGKTITLSDKQSGVVVSANSLKYNDGTNINNPSLSQSGISPQRGERVGSLTVSTPRGGSYQITLPDGTKVWLNAASSIIFPSTLSLPANTHRIVELVGEAYFEISKDKKRPFIVRSKGQEVEVLGTHFNINAYADEPQTKTTLLEGAVRVLSSDSRQIVKLLPGQQATLGAGTDIMVQQVDVAGQLAWKNGYFQFKDAPLTTVMRQIARWYNVEVTYKNKDVKTVKFGGEIARDSDISKVLHAITTTGNIKFKIEGRTIIVQ